MIAVVFPPQFEPFQPYLSPYYLKGLLKHYSRESKVWDANIDFYDWLFRNRPVTEASKTFAFLSNAIDKAVSTVKEGPCDIHTYREAISTTDRFLNHFPATNFDLGLSYLRIHNRYSSEALKQFVDDRDNILWKFFKERIPNWMKESRCENVFISLVVLDQLPASVILAKQIKENRPGVQITVGGPIVSRLCDQLTKIAWLSDYFDNISPGEAYTSIPTLLGLGHTYDGHVSPDFSDCEWEKYLSGHRVLPYLVAHGCKWGKCTFCSHHLTYDGYRSSTIDQVVTDLQLLSDLHRCEYVSFCDEYLTPIQLDEISDRLISAGLNIKWSTFARPEPEFKNSTFTSKLCLAGCRMLMFGFESGSQQVLHSMKKGTSVKNYRPILESCKEAHIAVRLDIMVGFPGEDHRRAEETLSFLQQNKELIDTPFSSYSVAVFELRSGIPIMEDLEQLQLVRSDLLRGNLDDQYQYVSLTGLAEVEKVQWRQKLIRYFKTELSAELLAPMNKTHQLILKDLFDQGKLPLPVLEIKSDWFEMLFAEFTSGNRISPDEHGLLIENYCSGGLICVAPTMNNVIELLKRGSRLHLLFGVQDEMNKDTFCKFVDFLYRNGYIVVRSLESNTSPPNALKDSSKDRHLMQVVTV